MNTNNHTQNNPQSNVHASQSGIQPGPPVDYQPGSQPGYEAADSNPLGISSQIGH